MPSIKRKRRFVDSAGEIWEQNESIFRQLFEAERKTLEDVKRIMEREHGFPIIPLSTYETKFRDKLGLRKKLKKADWSAVYQQYLNRNGRPTGVYLNGTEIPWKKAWKEIRRSGARSADKERDPTLPAGLVVRTPPPIERLVQLRRPSHQRPSAGLSPMPCTLSSTTISAALPPTAVMFEMQNITQLSQNKRYSCASISSLHQRARIDETFRVVFVKARPHLIDLPTRLFMGEMIPIIKSVLREPNGHIKELNNQLRFSSTNGHMAARSDLNSPEALEATFHSIIFPCLDRMTASLGLKLDFSAYHFLTKAAYQISNQLLRWEPLKPWDPCPEIFEILLNRIPKDILLEFYQSDIPTAEAIWDSSVGCAGRYGYRDAFTFLMGVGLHRFNRCIHESSAKYLSYAASMGEINVIRELFEIGVRADTEQCYGLGPAILQAAANGNLQCVELLLERCDVNHSMRAGWREDKSKDESNFELFLAALTQGKFFTATPLRRDHGYLPSSFKASGDGRIHIVSFCLENEPQRRALDMMLDRGANVDSVWKGNEVFILSRLYKENTIPMDWLPTLLEQSYYWDATLFHKLLPYSTRTAGRIIRPDICLKAKQGKEALCEYLMSYPTEHNFNTTAFLELILVEQFLARDGNIDLDVVRGLIEFGIDPKLPSLSLDANLLLYHLVINACLYGHNDDFKACLALLLRSGAVINSQILEAGVEDTGLGILMILSRYGADVSQYGAAALCTAARLDNYEAVEWLLGSGVDINATINVNSRPLSVVALASIGRGFSSLWSCDEWNLTVYKKPLDPASCEMLEYFIDCGAILKNSPHDATAFNFLHNLLRTGYPDHFFFDKVALVLRSAPDVRSLSSSATTLLEACINPDFALGGLMEQRLDVFELLLRDGAPLTNSSLLLPSLIYHEGPNELIQELLRTCVDINAYSRWDAYHRSHFQCTPIQAAAYRGRKTLVEQLLRRGANINQPAGSKDGETTLQAACDCSTGNKMELIQFLVDEGADVNAPPALQGGLTALQLAAWQGDMEVAALLLHHKANPNAPPAERNGLCALDWAALLGRLDMVKYLLNVGALSHNRGQTGYDGAIAAATNTKHFAVSDLIRQHAEKEMEIYGVNLAMSFQQ
ncbi:hypothetical protein F5Y13DRAFT_204230 [Hypoxylon sp. FL1857]|nr:hypothetical protein F5Y13DRAFT_204230 [Hypoxylon sp. FL1857]